jgi:hypothetical protein
VDNRFRPLVDNLPNVCSNIMRHAGLKHIRLGYEQARFYYLRAAVLAITRRQLQGSPHSPPDDLARHSIRERLHNCALT